MKSLYEDVRTMCNTEYMHYKTVPTHERRAVVSGKGAQVRFDQPEPTSEVAQYTCRTLDMQAHRHLDK